LLILLVTALIVGSIGIFVSSIMKSTIASTVLTYAAILLSAIGLPIVAGIVSSFLGVLSLSIVEELDWIAQALLIYLGGFLLCTNPFATAVATKLIEDSENTLFFFTTQVNSRNNVSHSILLVSPWIVYVVLYTGLSTLLIMSTILVIERKRG
jgi:hypothetical protein